MSVSTYLEQSQSIINVCQRLYARGWLAACDGNVSMKIEDDLILITPSQKHKGFLEPEELALMTVDGKVLEGKPSSETAMHLAIYQNCKEVQGVVHAHPPVSTAWSIANPDMKELPLTSLSEAIPTVGSIPIVPYTRPGTEKMGESLLPYLPKARVMILSNHGALSFGASLEEAFYGMERLEHIATTLMHAKTLGGLHPLPEEEITYLRELRKKIGDRIL